MKRIARLNRLVEKRDNNKMNQKDFNKKFIEIVGEEMYVKCFGPSLIEKIILFLRTMMLNL